MYVKVYSVKKQAVSPRLYISFARINQQQTNPPRQELDKPSSPEKHRYAPLLCYHLQKLQTVL